MLAKYSILLVFIAAICFSLSCNNNLSNRYSKQIKIAYEFIDKIKSGDSIAVKNMIGIELEYVGLDDEILAYRINRLREILSTHDIPNKSKFQFIEYTQKDYRLVDIIIPLNGKKETNSQKIKIYFAKFTEAGKILDFDIEN